MEWQSQSEDKLSREEQPLGLLKRCLLSAVVMQRISNPPCSRVVFLVHEFFQTCCGYVQTHLHIQSAIVPQNQNHDLGTYLFQIFPP